MIMGLYRSDACRYVALAGKHIVVLASSTELCLLQRMVYTCLSRWLLAKADHDVEEVSRVVGQSKPIPQNELLVALVAIIAVQQFTLHTAPLPC